MRDEKRPDKEKQAGKDSNPDPITGAPGSHPVGTGIGAAAVGAAAGAAVGTVAGPVGTVAGTAAGAVVGGLIGKGVAEAINATDEDAYWREHHAEQTYGRDRAYEDYHGAYRTGYEGYGLYGRTGRTFAESEAELQRDYERNRGTSTLAWNEGRDAAYAAWHRIHGRSERITDYEVQDQTNNKIGTVHSLWVDHYGQPTFIGVKTGWIFGKTHVVPVHTATVNDAQRTVRLPFTEQKVKDAPTFDADSDLSDADEARICSYYSLARPQGRVRVRREDPFPEARYATETGQPREGTRYERKERSKP